nr:hypothetical protein [Tanacetum cinerariifolium]
MPFWLTKTLTSVIDKIPKEPVPDDLKFERQPHRNNHQENDEIKSNASKKGKRKVLDDSEDDPVEITQKGPSKKSKKAKKSKSSSKSSADMTNIENLINKQFSQSLKQHSELITMVTSIQKQMELQALEAKHREQEIRKHAEEMVNNIQKQMEDQALEAERREKEIERRAEVRAHAIICEIERLRSIHEQEQNQLRVSLNQGNNVHGVDTSQIPQMSRTSSHLQHVVSKYYDSTQGDEIPKEIQSLYGDIFGPRR